ncbi:MAG: PKD domain-containing protein [Candidatus Bipolaricaulota bacterium]|nr:PKD domain-containing protein [Candidatus Bipolaricaulota bacterium]
MRVRKVSLFGLPLLLAVVVLLVPLMGFAQGDGFYTVSQGETQVPIVPLANAADPVAFYKLTNMQSATGFEKPNTAIMFLYQNTVNGQISLFVLLGAVGGTAGSTTVTLSGVPAGAKFQVQDDGAGDFREQWQVTPPTGSVSWVWDQGRGDGLVLGPLGNVFQVTLFPQFTAGITDVKFLSGDRAVPQTIALNRVDPIIVGAVQNQPPTVSFSVSTANARVNQPLTLDASASRDANGQIVKYEWDFNGDGIFDQTTTEPTVSYTYATSGTKSITVRATDNEGATARATQTVSVGDLAVRVTRTISTSAALPGSTFLVIVRMEPQMDVAGVGLQENLPVGWQIKPLENAGAAFKRSTVQWIFVDTIRANSTKVISYELTVPPASQLMTSTMPVCFTLSGTFQAMTPFMELPVEGDTKVEVASALPLKEAIAHLVPRMGLDSEDTVDLRLSQKIDSQQLARALEMWQNDESVPWTAGATISLEDMKELSAYAYTCTPVDLPLPLVPAANINAVRTILAPVPCNNVLLNYTGPGGDRAGSTFTVKIEIWADQDLYGVGLNEDVPAGWKVIPVENDGLTYKRARTEWVFPTKLPAGVMKTIIYQVEVPATQAIEISSSDPCYASSNDLYGVVDAALPCMETTVTGDSGVDVSECVSVLVAISRWDVQHDQLDITLSDRISFQQVQRAIAFWLEDEVVPWTCGQTVGYHMLKEIIAYWLTGTNICDPLPVVPTGPCDPDASVCSGG